MTPVNFASYYSCCTSQTTVHRISMVCSKYFLQKALLGKEGYVTRYPRGGMRNIQGFGYLQSYELQSCSSIIEANQNKLVCATKQALLYCFFICQFVCRNHFLHYFNKSRGCLVVSHYDLSLKVCFFTNSLTAPSLASGGKCLPFFV